MPPETGPGRVMGSIRSCAIAGPFATVRQGFSVDPLTYEAGGNSGGAHSGQDACGLAEVFPGRARVTMCSLPLLLANQAWPALFRPHG